MQIKVLFDPETGKLFGAQIVGGDGVDKRIDVLSTTLHFGGSVEDLVDLELAYAPPFGAAKDPVNMAGMTAQNVRKGLVRTAQWDEVLGASANGSLILDVRTAEERAGGHLPGSIHIPLHELRRRLTELPRDREIIVHCRSGQRSYNACRILQQHGFRCRNLSGAMLTLQGAK
jgi:rhodanese-related sulfurtransferase